MREREKGLASLSMPMEMNTSVNIKPTKSMDRVFSLLRMGTNMKVSSKMTR